jgi:hypothetical protein
MRLVLGGCFVFAIVAGSIAVGADPTDADVTKLVEKLKGKTSPRGKLAIIDLGGKKVTDNDLKVIAASKTTRELVLSKTSITDDGLKIISTMPDLRKLTVDSCKITDAGLANLAGMKNLTDLILNSTKVTDAGMESLTKIPKLAIVGVLETKVTVSGEGTLKRWKPDIKVAR